MTREIKFRAWTPPEKPYRDVESASVGHNGKMIYEGFSVSCKGTPHNSIGYTPLRLMQYTGLKDKNGKEIYEGDIVEWKYINAWQRNEIKWVQGGFVSIMTAFKDELNEMQSLSLISKLDCENIGNIYENPELLK